ncbi:astacin-like metalloendopeptidase [Budorcas taxicolor]|uniref:astacin-like metalloendopeptidase n=1 Tax=Budorcas taxicolor TaxID=37181 RepID=UPI00228501D3|nr:astacin-like metalloendopeptidase [Budorcas taxicolor]
MSMEGLWPWALTLVCLPGFILGAPSASHCVGARGTRFSEDLTPEETQTSWDKDIPAINQGLIPKESPESSFLLEGDILRPSPFRLFSATSSKWPKNGGVVEVPFLLSSKYDKPSRRVILEAFAEFERFTCIRFVAYDGQRDFISIVPMTGCFSSIGRSGGMQVVSLGPSCLQRGPGIVLHELMHVLGFWHEHSRADRDRYIRVNWNEILPGFEMNFIKSRSSNMLVPYDYSSVMHYGRLAFSRRGLPTITPLWAPSVPIGQRWNLSNSDIARVRRFYDCSPGGREPSGRGLQTPGSGRSPTPGSRSLLQQLLKALLEESSRSDPRGFGAEDQHAAARSEESLRAWKPPTLRNSEVKASADPAPSAPSFLPEAKELGLYSDPAPQTWPEEALEGTADGAGMSALMKEVEQQASRPHCGIAPGCEGGTKGGEVVMGDILFLLVRRSEFATARNRLPLSTPFPRLSLRCCRDLISSRACSPPYSGRGVLPAGAAPGYGSSGSGSASAPPPNRLRTPCPAGRAPRPSVSPAASPRQGATFPWFPAGRGPQRDNLVNFSGADGRGDGRRYTRM